MKFGFVTNVLKNIGKAVLPVAEEAGVLAANAALPGLGGTLAQIAIQGITGAIAKHGNAPASSPAPSDPTITVGQAKKFDVMQLLEANAPEIMDLILAGAHKKVVDRAKFVEGTDKLVEGLLEIMQAIGAVPSSTPPVDPVVITPALIAETRETPAPSPLPAVVVPTPSMGTILNLSPTAVTKGLDPNEVVSLLMELVSKLQSK